MGRVITVRGYRAFIGIMKILWRGKPAEEIYGDWLYVPATNRWHCQDKDYPADICMITEVD